MPAIPTLADGELSAEVMARLDRELGVINKLGFAELLPDRLGLRAFRPRAGHSGHGARFGRRLAGFLRAAPEPRVPAGVRLAVRAVPGREPPRSADIDIDFCQQRRGEVIQYVKDKYGVANVAQIGTFGTLAARAAIRDVGRAWAGRSCASTRSWSWCPTS